MMQRLIRTPLVASLADIERVPAAQQFLFGGVGSRAEEYAIAHMKMSELLPSGHQFVAPLKVR